MTGKYHLTARPNRHARNKVWYTWWWEQDARGQIIYDEAGNRKRVYKSTGCSRKSDALKVLAEWGEQDKHKLSGTLREFAEDMFIRGKCPYLAWKPHLKDQTVYQH